MERAFWQDWIEADELDRVEMIRKLPPFRRGGICRMMTPTLLNSYLVDLHRTMKKEEEEKEEAKEEEERDERERIPPV
jgi:hypothetical protein